MASILDSYTFNNGVTVKNRLAVAPMTHWSSDANGHATAEELAYIKPRAAGFGMFIAAATAVNPQSRAFIGEPNANADSDIEHLKKIANTIKSQGALAILQLHHGGKESLPDAVEGLGVVAPVADAEKNAREMTLPEIKQTIADFATAARRAMMAGFDGVEIHGANNYLLQQFVSPHHNHRTDEYGGSLENRLRFPVAVLDSVQAACKDNPNFIIGYRITPEEPFDDGITMTDTLALIDALKQRRLQYIHISLQGFYNKARRGADANRMRLDIIHEHLANSDIALIGVGGLRTPQQAIDAFNTGVVEFTAVGLGVLANPDFALRVADGNFAQIRESIDLNKSAEFYQMPPKLWEKMGWFVK
ncbi:MAG: NADH-dependent flavin oxidoreductase [Neisseriaceae bacterium]|nr:NADH-dependent flavin oxidoreductase [Neisseriaceae bacterium]MBR1819262.1 NADH-dependent flavin oxidoreductase [Neisseriaceae bacterium]